MSAILSKTLTFAKKRNRKRQQGNSRVHKLSKAKAIEPTPEQKARNNYKPAGMAYVKTPVIDSMLERKQITQEQHKKLGYYRQQASLADSSPTRDSCDFSVRGGGDGPSAAIVSANLETDRIEADMGNLRHIVRAIAVDDISITEWCKQKTGRITRPSKKRIDHAMLDLHFGIGRIILR